VSETLKLNKEEDAMLRKRISFEEEMKMYAFEFFFTDTMTQLYFCSELSGTDWLPLDKISNLLIEPISEAQVHYQPIF
jgi:hypothetical protein